MATKFLVGGGGVFFDLELELEWVARSRRWGGGGVRARERDLEMRDFLLVILKVQAWTWEDAPSPNKVSAVRIDWISSKMWLGGMIDELMSPSSETQTQVPIFGSFYFTKGLEFQETKDFAQMRYIDSQN